MFDKPSLINFLLILGEEFWLGLDNIYKLTQSKSYTLRFTLETFEGVIKTQFYTNFKLLDDVSKYHILN